MNRNISIVVVLLVLVVIAGYLIWLRSKFQPTVVTPRAIEQVQVTSVPTPIATLAASPSATPVTKEATGSTKQKTATPAATRK